MDTYLCEIFTLNKRQKRSEAKKLPSLIVFVFLDLLQAHPSDVRFLIIISTLDLSHSRDPFINNLEETL